MSASHPGSPLAFPSGPAGGGRSPGRRAAGFHLSALAHEPRLVRLAPWLLLLAVLFLLVFVPLSLLPQVTQLAGMESRLTAAQRSALQAERLATSVAGAARQVPALESRLARAEAGLVALGALPGSGTLLAAHARESGVTLLSAGYGPFTELAPSQPQKSATGQTAANATPLPYGQVTLDLVAQGSWSGLARFLGLTEGSTPGLRVTSWSVAASGAAPGTFQLHLTGLFYVHGRPPVQQAVVPAAGPGAAAAPVAPAAPAAPGRGG
ncbi:MAG: hypothetical protein IRZ26_09945 [Clostridia bacterium]|nr:hypothetical protein [Clostridia bacterium]